MKKAIEFVTWKAEWLSTPYYGFAHDLGKKALILPRYQRSYVWNEERRRHLFDSLQKGYPIGALILRRTHTLEDIKNASGESVPCEVFEVIDGLQRSTSIIFHQLNPLQVVTPDFAYREALRIGFDISALANLISEFTDTEITSRDVALLISNWAKDKTKEQAFESQDGAERAKYYLRVFNENAYGLHDLIQFIALVHGITTGELTQRLEDAGLIETLHELLTSIKKSTSISSADVPVIIWDGPAEDAPDIFFRVNQGGVKLTKYQVLAAAWAQKYTDIRSGEVADAAKKILLPAAGSVLIKKQTAGIEYIDLYEALVGMSHLLGTQFPNLFKMPNTDESNESKDALEAGAIPYFAFNIAALVAKTKLSDMKNLAVNMEECEYLRGSGGNISIEKMWLAIKEACHLVNSALYVLGYALKGANTIAHAEQPLAALIARLAVELLRLNGQDSEKEVFKRTVGAYIPAHYLCDVLGGITSSHGTDAAAFNRVWTVLEADDNSLVEASAYSTNDRYVRPLDISDFDASLNSFWVEQMQKKVTASNKGRPTVDAKQKLVLKFVSADKASWASVATAANFHIDHSVPFSLVKDWSKQNGGTAYIGGCVANLAILPEAMNLNKAALTVEEWLSPENGKLKKNISPDAVWSLLPYGPGDIPFGSRKGNVPTAEEFAVTMNQIWEAMKVSLRRNVGFK